jgi:cbb3-type cytochrome oxidase subunit 1
MEEGAFLFSWDVYLFLLIGMLYKIKYNHVYVSRWC